MRFGLCLYLLLFFQHFHCQNLLIVCISFLYNSYFSINAFRNHLYNFKISNANLFFYFSGWIPSNNAGQQQLDVAKNGKEMWPWLPFSLANNSSLLHHICIFTNRGGLELDDCVLGNHSSGVHRSTLQLFRP